MRKNLMLYVIVGLSTMLSSCSSFGMARKCPCEDIVIPPVPIVETCVAHADGTAFCCMNGDCKTVPVINKVCRQASHDADLFKWINYVTEVISP